MSDLSNTRLDVFNIMTTENYVKRPGFSIVDTSVTLSKVTLLTNKIT